MKIFVKVKPKAKREGVEEAGPCHFVVTVKESPEKGAANRAVERVLARHFNISVSRVRVVSGKTSRQKIIEIS